MLVSVLGGIKWVRARKNCVYVHNVRLDKLMDGSLPEQEIQLFGCRYQNGCSANLEQIKSLIEYHIKVIFGKKNNCFHSGYHSGCMIHTT